VLRRGATQGLGAADGPARFELRGFLEPAAVKLTRRGELSFEAEGGQRASLRLTRRGRRALARRGPARVSVVLDAPYGFGVQATRTLR
jgi:hypothetical protein